MKKEETYQEIVLKIEERYSYIIEKLLEDGIPGLMTGDEFDDIFSQIIYGENFILELIVILVENDSDIIDDNDKITRLILYSFTKEMEDNSIFLLGSRDIDFSYDTEEAIFCVKGDFLNLDDTEKLSQMAKAWIYSPFITKKYDDKINNFIYGNKNIVISGISEYNFDKYHQLYGKEQELNLNTDSLVDESMKVHTIVFREIEL